MYTCTGGKWTAPAECVSQAGGDDVKGGDIVVGTNADDGSMMTLNNGLQMPLVSFGFEVYSNAQARSYMAIAIDVGYRNFFASVLANNQRGAAQGITDAAAAGVPRSELFICGSVTQCRTSMDHDACYTYTKNMADRNLVDLGLTYLDQIMLDYPPDATCSANTCMLIKAQWEYFEEMYADGRALSIAVSNYCPCQIECLTADPTATVPAVNQLNYHVGMGADPSGMVTDDYNLQVVPQAYSPLGHGHRTLTSGPLTTGIATKYGKSAAQVAYKWVAQHGVSVCMSSTSRAHFIDDIDLFSWTLADEDMAALDAAHSPGGSPASCYRSNGRGRRLQNTTADAWEAVQEMQ